MYQTSVLAAVEQADRRFMSRLALSGLLRAPDGTIIARDDVDYLFQNTDTGGPSDGVRAAYVDDGGTTVDDYDRLDDWVGVDPRWTEQQWAQICARAASILRDEVLPHLSTMAQLYAVVDRIAGFDESPRQYWGLPTLYDWVGVDLDNAERRIRLAMAKVEERAAREKALAKKKAWQAEKAKVAKMVKVIYRSPAVRIGSGRISPLSLNQPEARELARCLIEKQAPGGGRLLAFWEAYRQ